MFERGNQPASSAQAEVKRATFFLVTRVEAQLLTDINFGSNAITNLTLVQSYTISIRLGIT